MNCNNSICEQSVTNLLQEEILKSITNRKFVLQYRYQENTSQIFRLRLVICSFSRWASFPSRPKSEQSFYRSDKTGLDSSVSRENVPKSVLSPRSGLSCTHFQFQGTWWRRSVPNREQTNLLSSNSFPKCVGNTLFGNYTGN